MCINQIHSIKSKNNMKIQFNHFSALLYFTNLLITPLRTPLQNSALQILPIILPSFNPILLPVKSNPHLHPQLA